MQIFQSINLPFCKVLMMNAWNEPAHRYFIAYNARDDFRHVLGLPVIDEYATFSSPIFFAPVPILGKIYNAGISLGHLRDPEMGLDTGWPPLCIGTDAPLPELPLNWEKTLIQTLQSTKLESSEVSGTSTIEDYFLQRARIGGDNTRLGTTVFATNAPVLPRQLKRICQLATRSRFSIAFSIGNRIQSKEDPIPENCQVLSEETFRKVLIGFEELERAI